jgi:hypothetical protein
VSGPASRDGETRFLAALAAALERGAARAEPVSVLAVVAASDHQARAALEAGRVILPAEGLAVPLDGARLALLLPAIGLDEARARAARLAASCPGAGCGAAAAGEGGPVGPETLLAEAEARAVGAVPAHRELVFGGEEVGGAGESC